MVSYLVGFALIIKLRVTIFVGVFPKFPVQVNPYYKSNH